MDNELRNGKREMDEMYKDLPFIQERVSDSPQGTGRGREHLNRALIDLQDSVDFLRELQSEWAWKRNTIKKNNREMAELDELVARIDRRLKSNAGNEFRNKTGE